MAIDFACQSCGKSFSVKDELGGKKGKCTACGAVMIVPSASVFRPAPMAVPVSVPTHPVVIPTPQPAREPVAAPKGGNPVSIASLVLGIVAVLICWMPFLGLFALPVAALGALLGVVGLAVAIAGRRSGLTASGVGAGLSLLAAIASILITGAFAGAVKDGIDQANARANPVARPVARAGPEVAPAPKVPDVPAEDAAPEPAVGMGRAARLGDVEITVSRVEKGKTPIVDKIPFPGTDGKGKSQEDLLSVYIVVKNVSKAKKLNYRTMGSDQMNFGSTLKLSDNHGNTYRGVNFGFSKTPEGSIESESIYPGKEVEDHLVFELPVEAAEYLDLELPAERAGDTKGTFRFRIPTSKITAK